MPSDAAGPPLHDPRALRALTHPIRLALLELLDRDGPLTATEAGDRLGESPASCSFHLRTLAKYGFVEEAPGGRGRQRPWQIRRIPAAAETELTAENRRAAQAYAVLMRDRQESWQRRWDAERRSFTAEWRDAAIELHIVLHLTAAELRRLGGAMAEAARPYADRDDPGGRPAGSSPVSVSVQAFPLSRPSGGTPHPSDN